MRTWTGKLAPLINKDGVVHILDLVVHLGRERRWGGWGSQEWTVLHHSMLVALLWTKAGFPPEELIHALLHDAHEGFTRDIPSPVKNWMAAHAGGADGVRAFEGEMDSAIDASLDLQPMASGTERRIKVCDLAALVIEAPLFGPPKAEAVVPPEYLDEVMALVQKAIPDLSEIVANRSFR